MNPKLPSILNKDKLCIVCEGSEEYDYLDRLKGLGVWNDRYDVALQNADGNGNVPARYQDRYQSGSYEVVFAFCDTDKKPYEQYEDIKKKINEFHGVDDAADEVVIYGNPCTMQIILQHWSDVKLNTSAKKMNAPLIEELTGIKNYKGKEEQRCELMSLITADNYPNMVHRVQAMTDDDTAVASSNFGKFLNYVSSDNDSWIDEINAKLEA